MPCRHVLPGICLCLTLTAADLPVKQVTLYKHGIGFFEREGVVPAGEEARLDFKNSEMNDVLKSLIISVSGGGTVAAVRYDSNATLEQQLDKFPFAIGNAEALSGFLDRLKGAHLEIKLGDRTLSGVIMGARALTGASDDNRQPVEEQVTLLLDSGDVANFELAAITSMHLLDAHLQQQLKDYLQTLAQAKAKDTRSLYLGSSVGARTLRLSYIAPTAIWKSSYRLSLGEQKSTLEGWAIVDNTSDEDWDNVRLSVVSGRPISFISLLDVPRFGNRQIAELPEDRAAGPAVYGDAIAKESSEARQNAGLPADGPVGLVAGLAPSAKTSGRGGGAGGGEFARLGTGNQPLPESMNEFTILERKANLQSSVRGAGGETLGELFEYNFPGPVTIRKNQSAMLPFLQDSIDARKLLIHRENDGEHPVNAVELSNRTGKTLDGGPITVFDGGAYAGEALFETLKTNDKRLIGYAVDYGTRISSAFSGQDTTVREISARNGVVEMRLTEHRDRTYNIQNVDSKAKTVMLEQEGVKQYSVISPNPTERTATAYRFEVAVPAAGAKTITVKQERIITQQTSVNNAPNDFLLAAIQNKQLSTSGRRQLQAIIDLKNQIADAMAAQESEKKSLQDLTDEQTRLRQNINSLNQVKGQEEQVRQYSSQLASNEAAMAKLRDQRDASAQRRLTLEDQLRQAIAALDF